MQSLNALKLDPAIRQTLTESVTVSLRSAILVRSLRPGQRIPEARIASKLGVSRAPVREALAVLLQEGLVLRDARGICVTYLSKPDVDEISSLRIALEKLAIKLATQNATDEDYEGLKENIRRTARAKAHGAASELDLEFHELLVRAAKSKRLLNCWLSLRLQILLLLNQMDEEDTQFPQHAAGAHQELLDLLVARDEKSASSLLERHLENTHQAVAKHFAESDALRGDA